MSEQLDETFADRMLAATKLLSQAVSMAVEAVDTDLFQHQKINEAIQNFVLLQNAFGAWKPTDLQSRYQSSFITLINDAILWLEATRDGGNDLAAIHDMQKASNARS